jgi:hypothetical protein
MKGCNNMKKLYAKFVRPESGYDDDQKACRDANLVLNKAYEVRNVNMSPSITRITLENVKGVFNSVNFDFYEIEKIDLTMSPKYNPYLPQEEVPEKLKGWDVL